MRAALAVLAAVLTVPLLAVPASATTARTTTTAARATTTAPTGLYEPVSRVRAFDSRTSGRVQPRATTMVRVTGLGQVPATGVVAVSVNLTVLRPGISGSLTVVAHGTSWSGATMSFRPGINQNFETVPVDAGGLIDIRNNAHTGFDLVVDVLGYYTSGQPQLTHGRYQPLFPTRVLDTRSSHALGSHQTFNFPVAGVEGIPSGDVAPVIDFTVLPDQAGSLSVWIPEQGFSATPSISWGLGPGPEQSQLLVALSSSGTLTIRNNSSASVQVIADVVGYYTGDQSVDQGFLAFGLPARAYDSRAAGTGPVPPGRTVEIPILQTVIASGRGLPPKGIAAASIRVTVLNPNADGSVSVWPTGIGADSAAAVSFAGRPWPTIPGQTVQRELVAKAGANGDVLIRNNSQAALLLIVDLNGWAANT